MRSFKYFFRFFILSICALSLSKPSLAHSDESSSLQVDFEVSPWENVPDFEPQSEFTPKEEERIRELILMYNYSFQEAENKVRKARRIRKAFVGMSMFTVSYFVGSSGLSDFSPALSSLNNLGSLIDRIPGKDRFLVIFQGDTFRITRNTLRTDQTCIRALSN